MAAKKAKKQDHGTAGQKTSDGEANAADGEGAVAMGKKTKPKKSARRRGRPPGKTATRRLGRPHKAAAAKESAGKKGKRGARGRKRYSDAERRNILETASREGLTGAQVNQRFGVTTVTYYSWRKKSGTGKRRRSGRAVAAAAVVGRTVGGVMNVADAIRDAIRSHVRRILPEILASELGTEPRGNGRSRRSR